MMVGRFLGAAIMQRVSAETLLAAFSIVAFIVMLVTVFAHGPVAMWSLILVGLFHSIMFPTIFALGIRGLGPVTEEGSGLLIDRKRTCLNSTHSYAPRMPSSAC